MDNGKMIHCIDQYLTKNKLDVVGAPEAVALLIGEKLYSGGEKSFRAQLQKGIIPHAHQIDGTGSRWVIPHSNNKKKKEMKEMKQDNDKKKEMKQDNNKQKANPAKGGNKGSKAEKQVAPKAIEQISQIEQARKKYKPASLKYLLIAEAPPDSLDRFFYYEDVKIHDELFLGVLGALQGKGNKVDFLASDRDKTEKESILKYFQSEGFYLLDCMQQRLPKDLDESKKVKCLYEHVPSLLEKVKEVIEDKTTIILIKTTVFDAAYSGLATEFPGQVICSRIPFPGSEGQGKFQRKFKKALRKAGYKQDK